MARIRQLKPEFWTDDKVAGLSRDARLLFLGLLTEADDDGRLVDSPKLLAGSLFPFDDDVTPKRLTVWLEEIISQGLVHRYYKGAASYLHVVNFNRHQKIARPRRSSLPAPAHDTQDACIMHAERVQRAHSPPATDPQPAEQMHAGRAADLGNKGSRDQGYSATPLAADAAAPAASATVVPVANGQPPWQAIVARRLGDLDTTGTWDLLTPYAASWDEIHDALPSEQVLGSLIALTCDFVTRVTGEPPPNDDRTRIAMLVRQHGKAALLGYSKALGATEDETPQARFRYARGVVNRFIGELEEVR